MKDNNDRIRAARTAPVVILVGLVASMILAAAGPAEAQQDGWVSLFDGRSLQGWKAAENPGTFSVRDGKIVVHGPRAHLFYAGPVAGHDFKDFEFKADVKTTEGSNSGIYFHTAWQPTGWPSRGYEVQVNNSHTDWRRTAGLYGIDDVREPPADDGEWFTIYIRVQGRRVTVKVNGQTMVKYTEPRQVDREGRVLASGTFALQGHDPDSKVYYRNIMVKPLDEKEGKAVE